MLVLAVVGGIGWYFSSKALAVAATGQAGLSIRADGPDRAVLSREGYADEAGLHGVHVLAGATAEEQGDGEATALGVVGDILDESDDEVVREWRPLTGGLPDSPVRATIDQDVFWPDPTAVDVPYADGTVPSELGPLPAWLGEGDGDAASTWVVFVHGRGATLEESLRYLPTLREAGVTTLVTTYRNDPGAPSDPSGGYRFGETEWRDVESAVAYAQEQGAGQVLLLGWSMGATIVLQAMDRSPATAEAVTGLWLNSPQLDWDTTFDAQGRLNGLPQPLTDVAKLLIGWRADLDFDDYDWPRRAAELPEVPIHIEHSESDTYVPNQSAVTLAQLRPDVVTLVQDTPAEHTREWNVDPEGYDARLADWLVDRAAAPGR